MTIENKVHHTPEKSGWGPLVVVLTIWAMIVGISYNAYQPVAPLPVTAAAEQFSAERVIPFLKELVGEAIPRPAGSPQNKIVRSKIVSMLESFGYSVEIQTGTNRVDESVSDRSPDKTQVELHNIIAVLKSSDSSQLASAKKIMLASHHDSVPSGPGASDDGVSTAAIIEIARMLASEPPPNRDIVFLITDGEEFGLLGAEIFSKSHPLADQIGVAINLDARGTTGPSCMFETSRFSRHLIPVFARSVTKKYASSLFFEIYRRMPNDTDFTVFNRKGMLGYNFAFIGDVKNYHTTADNFENVDRGSLQHQGENALGLVRELLKPESDLLFRADLDLSQSEFQTEAVYFEVFGKWMIWWPSFWSIWMVGITGCCLVLSLWRLSNSKLESTKGDRQFSVFEIVKHIGILILSVVIVFAACYFLLKAIRLDPNLSNPWPANPAAILIGCWFASFAVTAAVSLVFGNKLKPGSCWIALGIAGWILALLVSLQVTGASHLFLVPLLLASVVGMIANWSDCRRLEFTIVVTVVAIGFMWLPLERLFYDGVGFRMPIVMCARIAIVSVGLLNLLALANVKTRFSFALLCSIIAVISILAAMLMSR